MGDTVQLILERMVPELEDLQARGLFTEIEVKGIIQRRRDIEYTLAKRTAQADDYLRALEYEFTLEALRRKRRDRLGLKKTTMSDHAGTRRIHFIFDRACRKFRGDIRWWLQWLDFALRTNSGKAVGKILARALQLHPRSEELWLQAAEFEFDRQRNVTAARALLLRALRINRSSHRLWLAYFRLECLYVQLVRGRRLVLGLDVGRRYNASAGVDSSAAGLLPQAVVQAGAGTVAESAAQGSGDEAGGYEVMDVEEDGEAANASGSGAGGKAGSADGSASAEGAGSSAGGVVDAAASAGVPAPSTAGATSSTAGPASGIASFLDNEDARTAFFSGSVSRIVYTQAVRQFPEDLKLRAQFLDACDSLMDVTGATGALGQAAGTAGPGTAAFPELSAFILHSIAADFGDDPAAWEILATRPALGLVAAANARAAVRAAGLADGEDDSTPAKPVETMEDDDLFVVDKPKPSKASEDAEGAGAGAAGSRKRGREEHAAGDDDEDGSAPRRKSQRTADGGVDGEVFDGRGLPPPASMVASLQSFSAWLSSGEADSHLLVGLPGLGSSGEEGATAGSDAEQASPAVLLPVFGTPLWTTDGRITASAGSAGAAAPAPGSAKSKPGKASSTAAASESTASSAASLALSVPSAVDPLPDADAALESWATTALTEGTGLLQEAITEAQQAGQPQTAQVQGLLLASAKLHVKLAGLPLVPSVAHSARLLALLQSLATACAQVSTAGQGASTATVQPAAALQFTALHVQALLRLGRMSDALAVARALAESNLSEPGAVLLHARLAHMLHTLQPSALKGAAASEEGETNLVPLPAGSSIAVAPAQLTGWSGQSLDRKLLLTAIEKTAAATKHNTEKDKSGLAALWMALLSYDLQYSGPAAAVEDVRALGAAGLPAKLTTEVLSYYVEAAGRMAQRNTAVELQHIAAACSSSASESVHELALATMVDTWEARRAAASAGSTSAPSNTPALTLLRKQFEESLARHGKHCAGLWLQYLRLERLVAGGSGRSSMTAGLLGSSNASLVAQVYERAQRTLQGPAAAQFVQRAAAM